MENVLSYKEAIEAGFYLELAHGRIRLPTLSLGEVLDDVRDEDFIIITARGGTGKTWLMLQMAHDLSKTGTPVGFFSGEMSVPEIGLRFSKMEATLRNLPVMAATSEKVTALKSVQEQKIWLPNIESRWAFRTSCIPVMDKLREEHGAKIFFFDHLRYFLNEDARADERQRVEQTVLDMRLYAKKYKTPIVLAVQPKQIDSDTEASIDTMKGTSAISQDATTVIVLDRPRKKLKKDEETELVYEPYVVLKVEKSRHSAGNRKMKLFLDVSSGKFIEWDKGGSELSTQYTLRNATFR